MSVADRGMAWGLRGLRGLAGSELIDRVGLRKPIERLVFQGSKNGFRTATAAGRAFKSTQKLTSPARQQKAGAPQLFDLAPTEEQQMLQEAFGQFATERLRPVAQDADTACAAPAELLSQAGELGTAMLGVPEELGGAMTERAAVATVLVGEKLAHGDMGLAAAVLGPASVSTAISLWGDAGQQSRYLPPFTEDGAPAAAFALAEPRPLFDPLELQTTARKSGDGYELSGTKSLVLRVADAELFVVGAALDGRPALFVVEPGADGLSTEPEPAMGLRAAATGQLVLEGARGELLGDGDPADYGEAVQRARLAWCAMAIGTGQAVLDYVIPYVNERQAFGEPVSHRQAVAFKVADIAIELDGMRLATYRAAARADQGKDFAKEAGLAHRLCVEKGMAIGSDGVQLLGGHGYVKEYPVERWYRDLRTAGVMEGALLV
jgi:alkylation response protein AidB-like acyl-CoA dehydrogenase